MLLKRRNSQKEQIEEGFAGISNAVNSQISDNITKSKNRNSPINPYNNTNVSFSQNPTTNYVTNTGTYKSYGDETIYNSTAGKNGCPYNKNNDIPNDPYSSSLLQGTSIVSGQSCGNEGHNVYVTNIDNNPTKYEKGVYNNSSSTPSIEGISSSQQCMQYALDNTYTYYGIQDSSGSGGSNSTKCVVTNDLSTLTKPVPKYKTRVLWSSNTPGINTMYINTNGTMSIINNDGKLVWQSNEPKTDCTWSGNVNQDTITGSYGGNCIGKPLNIDCGNPDPNKSYQKDGILGNMSDLLKKTALKYSDRSTFSYSPLTDWSGGDPAQCCSKLIDYSYQCGGGPFKSGSIAGGTNINFDCSKEVEECSVYLKVENDGNVVLNKGVNKSNGVVWSSETSNKSISQNNNWVSENGKYRSGKMTVGQSLAPGEWIGSSNGYTQLMMQTDGNLVVNTSELIQDSVMKGGNEMYGVLDTENGIDTSVFNEITTKGNTNSLGKIGYVSRDSKLREYSSDMLKMSDEYTLYPGYDSTGNDITQVSGTSTKECETACNTTDGCAGFSWQTGSNMCFLKNDNMYPKGKGGKQISDQMTLGVRNKIVDPNKSCANKMVTIDSVQYDNYVKGEPLTLDTPCPYEEIVTPVEKDIITNVGTIFQKWSERKLNKITELDKNNMSTTDEMKQNEDKFNNVYKSYNDVKSQISKNNVNNSNNSSNNIIEGMTNTRSLNMNDVKRMQEDSSLIVLQEHYQYILWTALALGALIVTIKTIRKN